MLIQLLLSLILCAALLMTWRRARERAIAAYEAWLWSAVWLGGGIVIWRPDTTTLVAHFFGIGRGVDFVLYAAVIVLLLLVFHLHVAHDRLERTLTKLISEDALRSFERDQRS